MTLFGKRDKPTQATHEESQAPSSSEDVPERFTGFNERQAVAGLVQFNQAELTTIEAFERTHEDREPVLDKLRYLREPEPLADYDALEPGAIADALSGADAHTVKAVRSYERKHQNRPAVRRAAVAALGSSRDGPPADVVGNGLPVKVRPESELGTP